VQGSQKQLTMHWHCSFWQVPNFKWELCYEVPKKELTILNQNKWYTPPNVGPNENYIIL
jgi:hypothetical protein